MIYGILNYFLAHSDWVCILKSDESGNPEVEELVSRLSLLLKQVTLKIPGGAAISFSGGLDSSILLYLSHSSAHAYVVGIPGSKDIQSAMDSAARLHRDLSVVEVSEYQVLEAAEKIIVIDPGITMRDLGFETVLYLTLSGIREDTLVTGQGADEIFYGYHRFLSGSSGTNDSNIRKLLYTTIPREKKIAESLHKRIIAPYLEDGIFEYSSLGIDKHIIEGINKFMLRSAALLIGVPREICIKEKKAAQYGSGVDRVLRKHKDRLFPITDRDEASTSSRKSQD